MNDLFHYGFEIGVLLLGTWVAFLQRRSAKITELELRVVALEVRDKATDETLADVQKGLDDVRENMLRRGDIELLRGLLH